MKNRTQAIYRTTCYFMTFIMKRSNIRHEEEVQQKDDVATLIIMTNIILHYDSL